LDLAKVLEEPIIDRSVPSPPRPVTKKPVKCNLQDMLMVDKRTPLRKASRVHSLFQEKKHLSQVDKANRMI
jgi:hypothetical protein